MIRIYRVEVSTNGRTHLVHTENTSIEVANKTELINKRKELKEEFEKRFNIGELTIYLSYEEH